MDKKSYLKQMYSIESDIDVERQKYYKLEQVIKGKDGKWETTKEQLKKLQEYKQKTDARIDELLFIEETVINAIYGLTDEKQRKLMIMRYILLKRWDIIAVEMHYDERQLYRIHSDALQNIVIECQ